MKTFQVSYDTASSSGFTEILLVSDEKELETALEAKSIKNFKVGNPYSRITHKKEIPLSQVKIGELSIVEYLMLKDIR